MRFLKRLLPFVVIAAVALLLIYLPDVVPDHYTDLGAYFANERARQGFVGYSVASVRYGKPDFAGAFGTDARGLPLEAFTPMAIGDLSGAVTGLLVLGAEAEGRLSIDKPLSAYLPATLANQGSARSPTLRALLSHTSGLSDRDFDDRHASSASLEAGLQGLVGAAPRKEPGTSFAYLETGYEALGFALEGVFGQGFAELAAKRIFLPLKMMQSGAEGGEAAKRLPQGSTSFFWTAVPKDQDLPPSRVPSVGMVSTAPDFARLMAAIVSPGFAGASIAGKTELARLQVPLAAVGGFSYGWQVRETKQGRELRIEADTEAFSAVAAIWPERQAGIVIMAPENSLMISRLMLPTLVDGAKSILLSESAEPPLPLGRISILLAFIASVHIIALSAQTGAALSWARDVRGRAEATGRPRPFRLARIRLFAGLGVRLALIVVIPVAAGWFLGLGGSWTTLFDREPGFAGWILAAASLGMLRNIARLSWLRGPSSQVRKMRLLLRK